MADTMSTKRTSDAALNTNGARKMADTTFFVEVVKDGQSVTTDLDVSNTTEAKAVTKVIRAQNPDAEVSLYRTTEIDIDKRRAPRSPGTTKSDAQTAKGPNAK